MTRTGAKTNPDHTGLHKLMKTEAEGKMITKECQSHTIKYSMPLTEYFIKMAHLFEIHSKHNQSDKSLKTGYCPHQDNNVTINTID